MIRQMMLGTVLAGALAAPARGRDREHPHGRRAGHRIRQDAAAGVQGQETGIDVNLEVVNYAEMHTKLVPQLVAPKGSYSAIVVDFYWVGEFTKAGWLRRSTTGSRPTRSTPPSTSRSSWTWSARSTASPTCCPSTTTPWGCSIGRTCSTTTRTRPTSRRPYGIDLAPPKTWDEYLKQVEFFTKDGMHRRGQPGPAARSDRHGVVELSLRQWRRVS